MSLFRPTIEALRAYAPGEQPSDDAVLKLNTNENPYPPSPHAMAALAAMEPDQLRRYPRPFADEFRAAAADVLGLDPSWILVGNGSDDLLTMLLRSVAAPDRPVAYPVPTYSLYRTLAAIQDAPVAEVAFDETYTLPVADLVAAHATLTLIANPNSPSGTLASTETLANLAAGLDGLLVIDEAYVEFAARDALALTRRFDNVIVLRTLSKSHSLAGLRLGFAVAQPHLVTALAKVKDSYNVDVVAARVGAAAIRDVAHTRRTIERVRASRTALATTLSDLGFRVWPSEANFLLVRPPDGAARALHATLKRDGILVRYFDEPKLDDTLRITIGTENQHRRLLEALRAALVDSGSA